MNPHYSSEMADRWLRDHHERLREAHRDLDEAMDLLKRVALDFREGSQERFLLALRDASRARDVVWYLEQQGGDHV